MRKRIYISILVIILTACKDQMLPVQQETAIEPIFEIQKDYSNFKMKMTESDTLRIWFNRSICTYEGEERLLITKKNDSLKIVSELKDSYTKNKDWEKIYEKKIAIKDTIWGFEQFLSKNRDKLKTENHGSRLVVSDGRTALKYASEEGLVKSLAFMEEINQTMEVLYPNENYYLAHIEVQIE